MYGGTTFYWEIGETVPTAKAFVDAFNAKHGWPPGDYGATSYSAIRNLLEATQRVGAIDADKIVAELEGLEYDNYKGRQWFRPCTHQSFQDFWVLQSRNEVVGEWGYFDVVHHSTWDEVDERTCEELRGA